MRTPCVDSRYRCWQRAVFCLLCSIVATAALAFKTDQNYYAPLEPDLLGSAEIQHLQPGINKMALETRQGRFAQDGAISEFRYILEYFPNHPRALALATDLAIRAKRPEWVEPYFQKSLALYPNHASTYYIYGTYLQRTGKVSEAIKQYERALQLNGELVLVHYNLGLAYLEQRNLTLANRHAQIAYKNGAPLSGLREKLKQARAWKEIDDSATSGKLN